MLRVRVNWTGPTVVGGGLSTHYFNHADTQQGASDAALAIAAFWGAVDAQIGNSTQWTLDPIVAVMNELGVQTGQFTVAAASGSGALSATYEPPIVQGLVQWRTGQFSNGRELRGRTFIPGITQVNAVQGVPQAALVTAVNNAAAALVADVNTSFALWSKVGQATGSVTAGTMWTKFASLRSRRD